MQTLQQLVKRSNNNFDLIRFLASLSVLFSHSFVLFNNVGYSDPTLLDESNTHAGTLAVRVFFFLSGFFITNSIINAKSNLSFIVMRVFRIYPALIVCVGVTVFVIGPLVTTSDFTDYFNHRSTWVYLICNMSLYNIKYYLLGVFEHNHFPNAVNGSLWTLPIELYCYFITALTGFALRTENIFFRIVFYLCAATALYFAWPNILQSPMIFYVIGSVCYFLRNRIIIDWRIGLLLSIWALIYNDNQYIINISLIYNVLVIASLKWIVAIKLPGDFSYGVYIYSFVIQQLLAHYFPALTPYLGFAFALPVVIFVSVLSWFAIEKPFLMFAKQSILKRFQHIVRRCRVRI